ncbi:class I SAM-dependent methyltransferase [Candidatus Saccharibacteria bacterium]|nr:class I SAM-dependent methyltransferase [Candidatus Saccharibacteria bacterium]MCL1963159.1 class I SAM-dependent methyltransferase [Candidatus Saccharibacteria bacterium]
MKKAYDQDGRLKPLYGGSTNFRHLLEVQYGDGFSKIMKYWAQNDKYCERPMYKKDRDRAPLRTYEGLVYGRDEGGEHSIDQEVQRATGILDVGSGKGVALRQMLEESVESGKQTPVIGLDVGYVTDNDIDITRGGVLQLTNNIARIPDGSMDLIFACNSIFYYCNQKRLEWMIDEITRIAKTGAILRSETNHDCSSCRPAIASKMLSESGWAVRHFFLNNYPPHDCTQARFARKIGQTCVGREVEYPEQNEHLGYPMIFDHYDSLLKRI